MRPKVGENYEATRTSKTFSEEFVSSTERTNTSSKKRSCNVPKKPLHPKKPPSELNSLRPQQLTVTPVLTGGLEQQNRPSIGPSPIHLFRKIANCYPYFWAVTETQYRCLSERRKISPLLSAGVAPKDSRSVVTELTANCSNLSPAFNTKQLPEL